MEHKEKAKILGELIKEKFEESGLTVTEFARRIHTSRRNVYEIFQKSSIETDMLYNISKVLGSDWIVEYFIEKFKYNALSNKSADKYQDIRDMLMEFISENKRTINEIKALQHLILEELEKKK
ncbi:MAG: hypothetical protein KatS3mg027_0677 [Bacteroidia bacterium]|nr:MAG: hypothetical protein KatS3mg027_0677 [Bacteroidia bacterium]